MSRGLPGIRFDIVKPDFDVVALFPDPEQDTTVTEAEIDSIREAVRYRGWTVGPTAPTAVFDGIATLDTIKSYTVQSRSLGWIRDQPTANKYSALIDSVKGKLQANRIAATRAKLDTILTLGLRIRHVGE